MMKLLRYAQLCSFLLIHYTEEMISYSELDTTADDNTFYTELRIRRRMNVTSFERGRQPTLRRCTEWTTETRHWPKKNHNEKFVFLCVFIINRLVSAYVNL